MRLKAVEMQGFKSFPDKTKITFEQGVTAIIGPNGSGKSNISDAVRWVLGEMSMKSLRGSKMDDVIFNGTPNRPASNCASVSLYIDSEEEYSSAHQMTLDMQEEAVSPDEKPRLSDSPETVITRKYYRSGESEYYINRKLSRLRDIYEMFYDTGIGREGYSVISQGKIAEVLSQKGDERRSIFEEASGISRFRYRKTEAERKLADTENNLLRVTDILQEVASRVKPLEKQAENAKQYLILSEEKKGLEITLWLNRLDDLRAKRNLGEEGLEHAKAALEQAQNAESALEKELDEQLNESYEFSRLMSLTEQEKSVSERIKAEAEGEKAVCLNDLQHYEQIVIDSNREITESEQQSSLIAKQITVTEQEILAAKEDVKTSEEDCTAKETLWQDARAAVSQCTNAAEEAEQALTLARQSLSDLNMAEAALSAELEAAKKSDSESEERIAAGKERIASLEAECKEKEAVRDQLEAVYLETLSDMKEKREQIRVDTAEEATLREEAVSLRLKLTAAEQRRDSLQRMEQLFEGYSESVRSILKDGAAGKIRRQGGSNVVLHGPVSNILSADNEYVVALETALAASVQFVVVESAEDAKACIRYLKDHHIGRATFLPLDTVKGSLCDVSKIKNMEGYVGIASQLARFDAKFSGVANDLLGRTVIADHIDNATKIASATGYKVKIVTLDGQVIHPGGSFTGGASAKKVGVFTRAMDIERLSGEIREFNMALLELDRKASRRKRSITENETALAELELLSAEQKLRYDEAENEINGYLVRMEEELSHIRAIENGKNADSDGRRSLEERLAAVKQGLTVRGQAVDSAEEKNISCKKQVEESREAESAAYEALAQARIVVVSKRSHIDSLSAGLTQQTSLLAGIMDRIAALRVNVASAQNSITERGNRIAVVEEKIAAACKGIAAGEAKLQELIGSREAQENKLAEVRRLYKEAQQKREESFVQVTNEENNFRRLNEDFDVVTAKLWDEYELTYSDAETFRLPDEQMDKAPSRLASLKAKIRSMGVINVNAVEEYRETKERFDFLTAQVEDLQKTRRSLDGTISKLETEMKESFVSTFKKINDSFAEVFVELFGGGSARIELQDPEKPLECGIDIILKPPGKSVKSISLLSGGEQSFAAIALYLALQSVNPAPFCIFDEIESALDDINLNKFADYIRSHSEKTQYIVITHRRGTMERADTLYGVTMHQKGISDYIRLSLSGLDDKFKEYTN
ncbi:MAG: chromosome segregation protein SMC [Clostridia bacterium]|nr:chromosome segregation protein SMC [Clostridia bacterium]